MMSDLNSGHSTVVITGGGSGLGLASARRLLTDWGSVKVVVADIRPGGIEEVQDEFGKDRVLYIEANVAQVGVASKVFNQTIEWSGSVSGLVNCAGNSTNHASLDMTPEQWREVLDCHLDGHFYMCQEFARQIIAKQSKGSIVNFSSIAHAFGWPRRLPYSVSKAGIDALTRTLAVEWAEYGIRINAIAPGYINTPLVVKANANGYLDPSILDMHAMGRFGEPDEIATGVKFLLSNDASFITGEILTIDGGFSAKKIPWNK